MALPIRPTPILTGRDAERLEEYMDYCETHRAPLRHFVIDKNVLQNIVEAIRARKAATQTSTVR